MAQMRIGTCVHEQAPNPTRCGYSVAGKRTCTHTGISRGIHAANPPHTLCTP